MLLQPVCIVGAIGWMQRKMKLPSFKATGSFRLYDEVVKYLPADESTPVIISSDADSFAMIMSAFTIYEKEVRY